MKGILDGASVDLACTKCGRKTKKTIRWVKANKTFTCTKCRTVNTLDASNFKAGVTKVEAWTDLTKNLKK